MESNMARLVFFSLLIGFHALSECTILPRIPAHLVACYRAGAPGLRAPRRLDVFLSLVRKLEARSQLDLRMLATGLLRSLRLDGIEQSSANAVETEIVLPYRASAFQFHRYKLLMDLFLPSQELLDVDEILTVEEKCLLHNMISSGVRQWERGDESDVCPLSAQQSQNMASSNSRLHSRCPIEEGVIQTEWGTVSPGTVMAAIAASMENQRVAVTDILNANFFKEDVAEPLMTSALQEWYEDIETLPTSQRQVDVADIGNVWVATLAGDLAEVVVNQGPRVGSVAHRLVVGSNNRWNDTLLPRLHYIFPQNTSVIDWHITDAEILAGIDGLILSKYVPKWVEERRTLRLSQVLEMYYSPEGVSLEPRARACDRRREFPGLAGLAAETARLAHVLALRQVTVYIPVDEIERITNAVVEAFSTYVSSLLRQTRECRVRQEAPVMDLVVATDGAWKGYDVEQFMSWAGGALALGGRRGSLGLLHGGSGAWVVPPVANLTALFHHLDLFTGGWPTRLDLPSVLTAVYQHACSKRLAEGGARAAAGASTVLLVASPGGRASAPELQRARELVSLLRASYFDVYLAFLAQDVSDFQNINNEYLDYSELFLTTPSTSVADAIVSVDTYLMKSSIPARLFGALCPGSGGELCPCSGGELCPGSGSELCPGSGGEPCPGSGGEPPQREFEDAVLPGRRASYRIHPFYLRQQNFIQVQFRNAGQGQLLVCSWRGADASHSCRTLAARGAHAFNLSTPCPSPDFCPPAHFVATALTTDNLCAHKECRFPHEVGYYISHTGLRCLPLRGAAIVVQTYCTLEISLVLLLIFNALIVN